MKGFKKPGIKKAIVVFDIQLILNTLWSLLFFGAQNLLYGLIEIIVLWLVIATTIWLFWKIEKKSAIMLLPYIAWVSFATLLNYYIWMLNL